ncbi:MAG: SDR family oxidoreductase [Bacteroidota bacterium]
MKVLVIGSTGRAGRLLVKYSLEMGHQVTAFARNIDDYPVQDQHLQLFRGDVLYPALLETVMPGHDIVLSVIGIRQFSGPITLLSKGIRHISEVMQKVGIRRLLTITGAGILQENPQQLIMESLSFPPNLQNISLDHHRMWNILQGSELDWTIVSPAFMHNGDRTGDYLLSADSYPTQALNQVSIQDVADFMTKEMTENKYLQKRVGIAHPKK